MAFAAYGRAAPVSYGGSFGAYTTAAPSYTTAAPFATAAPVTSFGTTSYAPASYAPAARYGGAPISYAAPVSTIAAPAPITTMQAPMTTMSAPLTYGAPAVEYVTAAPMAAPVYEEVIQYPQTFTNRNLLAMGNVVSERVISIDELAAGGRYAATEPVMSNIVQSAPVVYETLAAPQGVVYETMAAPQGVVYETMAAPEMVQYVDEMGQPVEYIMDAAPVTYIG